MKPMFTEQRLPNSTTGTVHTFPDGIKSAASGGQASTHSAGVIGSWRPGPRIVEHPQAPFSQLQSVSKRPQWTEAEGPSGSVASQNSRELTPSGPPAFGVNTCSGGYGLSSSMWAAPSSTGSLSYLPDQDRLHAPAFLPNVSTPLNGESDTKANSPRQQPEPGISFDKQVGSTTGQVSATLQPSPEVSLGRLDSNSALGSPALSFTQTYSAPSTGSFLSSDSSASHPRNGVFNSMTSSDKHSPYGQQYDISCASSNNFDIDKVLNEHPWPLAMSFGEEAFYSKSNVTKTKSSSIEAGATCNSPDLWSPLDAPLPLPHRPPSDDKPSLLASPLKVQPHTSGVLSQLLSRIEQLERKTAKQDQDIHELKTKISLMGAQSQREKQIDSAMSSNTSFPSHAPSGNAFQTSLQSRFVPNPTVINNVNVPAGNLEVHPVATNCHPPNNGLQLRPPEGPSSQGALGVNSTMVSGFPQRQFGPLDYSTRRVNSVAPGLMQPPLHGMPPPNGPGIVNYRALLAADTECDYEYFIRRITKHNDQQASIFLQQKLKQSALAQSISGEKNEAEDTGHTEKPRKEITRLVIDYTLELMTNRFGNFLVSRAIEHATSAERLELATRIAGQIVTLAQDTFATHCLQKMIDVDEEGENHIRRMISQELLKKKETVTHKSAGHVWARLLSVGGGSSSTISLSTGAEKATGLNQYGDGAGKSGDLESSLNELLKGEWAATAKDEVGSLIVQSVLENWKEAAKTDVVEELLADIYSCAIQQWGNFVILHLIEHSTRAVQRKLFQRLTETQLACDLSIDNFGAKAIEKVLKVSGMESRIVEDYVKAICEYGHGRPALIDIACHQAGAQVLTLLFTSAPNPIRDLMIQTVRRNGVTMKSSKAGSKIWFLVERTRAWVGH